MYCDESQEFIDTCSHTHNQDQQQPHMDTDTQDVLNITYPSTDDYSDTESESDCDSSEDMRSDIRKGERWVL